MMYVLLRCSFFIDSFPPDRDLLLLKVSAARCRSVNSDNNIKKRNGKARTGVERTQKQERKKERKKGLTVGLLRQLARG